MASESEALQRAKIMRAWRWGLGIHLAVAAAISVLAYTSNIPAPWLYIPLLDKLSHFLLVGGAAFWLRHAFKSPILRIGGIRIPIFLFAAMILSTFEEAIQIVASNRDADVLDLLSNLAGMVLFWKLAGRWSSEKNTQL